MTMSYTLPERNAIIEELDDLAFKLGYKSVATISVPTAKLQGLLVEYRDMVTQQQCGNCDGCTC